MKRIIIILSTLAILTGMFTFLFLSLNNSAALLPTELKGKPLPLFSGKKLDPRTTVATILTNKDFKGPALINVWATWCPTCAAEHTVLNQLKNQGITIYGINYKDEPKAAANWLAQLGDPYVFNLSDTEGSVGIEMGVYGAPETFFLDQHNIIRYRHVGAITPENWAQELEIIYQSLTTSTQGESL